MTGILEFGFTELNINGVRLGYYRTVTEDTPLILAHYFSGSWVLDYGGIRDHGMLWGLITAVSSPG